MDHSSKPDSPKPGEISPETLARINEAKEYGLTYIGDLDRSVVFAAIYNASGPNPMDPASFSPRSINAAESEMLLIELGATQQLEDAPIQSPDNQRKMCVSFDGVNFVRGGLHDSRYGKGQVGRIVDAVRRLQYDIPTPQPTRRGFVVPTEHYLLRSLTMERAGLPGIPFLENRIIDLADRQTDTVSVIGLIGQCIEGATKDFRRSVAHGDSRLFDVEGKRGFDLSNKLIEAENYVLATYASQIPNYLQLICGADGLTEIARDNYAFSNYPLLPSRL